MSRTHRLGRSLPVAGAAVLLVVGASFAHDARPAVSGSTWAAHEVGAGDDRQLDGPVGTEWETDDGSPGDVDDQSGKAEDDVTEGSEAADHDGAGDQAKAVDEDGADAPKAEKPAKAPKAKVAKPKPAKAETSHHGDEAEDHDDGDDADEDDGEAGDGEHDDGDHDDAGHEGAGGGDHQGGDDHDDDGGGDD